MWFLKYLYKSKKTANINIISPFHIDCLYALDATYEKLSTLAPRMSKCNQNNKELRTAFSRVRWHNLVESYAQERKNREESTLNKSKHPYIILVSRTQASNYCVDGQKQKDVFSISVTQPKT